LPKKFEASVFNQLVRDATSLGEHHRHLPDYWADQQLIEISAESAEEALMDLADRYPTSKGYVISTLLEVKFGE
jgi:hypothetical protein